MKFSCSLDENVSQDDGNIGTIITISVLLVAISILTVFLICICYRRKRNKSETEPSIANDIRESHVYEETEYAKMAGSSSGQPIHIQEYQDLKKPSVEAVGRQISNTSSVKSK